MKIIYFTTTGNSLAVARAIGGELVSLIGAASGTESVISDPEAMGLVCPVYFGELPKPVAEFLGRVRLEAPYRFLVLTCGNTPAFAVNAPGGWDYVASVRMVDNYFPMFDVAKQIATLPAKHVHEQVERVCADIAARRHGREGVTLFGRVAGWWMRTFPLSAKAYMNFYIEDDKCTSCGVCARLCPIGNIDMVSGRPAIGERCLTCGACYHNCPSGAIRYKGEKSRVQYRHPGVTLGDILGAMGDGGRG